MIKTIISVLLLVLLTVNVVPETKEDTSFLPTSNDYGEITYINDLNDVRTEIKETGDVELSKWGKEVYMRIEKPNVYSAVSLTSAETFDNKLITKTSDKVDLEWYFKNITENIEGLAYEVILKEKPSTNVINFPIESKNLRFTYQSPLYIEYGLEKPNVNCNATDCQGSHRPINVVGSYAVYHSSKRDNEYKTGKAFHIYRPKIIDNNGDWIWAELNIENSVMTITINQEWLDNAVYPVTIDPDLGFTDIGVSFQSIAIGLGPTQNTYRVGSAWTMPVTGTANYIRARLYAPIGTPSVDCTVFINQKDSGGAGNHGQIATEENLAVQLDPAGEWVEFTLADEELTGEVDYILNIDGDKDDLGFGEENNIRYDNNGAVDSYLEVQIYGSEESPWVVNPDGTTRDYSIFVNYDEAPPEDTCSCPDSGDWNVACSDSCYITTECDLGGTNLALDGTGNFTIDNDILNIKNLTIDINCDFIKGTGNLTIIKN